MSGIKPASEDSSILGYRALFFCRNTVSVGTFITKNYVTFDNGASLSGAALSMAYVTLASATIILERDGVQNPSLSQSASPSQSPTGSQSTTGTASQTQSRSPIASPNGYATAVDMLRAKSFALLAAAGLINTVRRWLCQCT